MGCPDTSELNRSTLYNNPEGGRHHFVCCRVFLQELLVVLLDIKSAVLYKIQSVDGVIMDTGGDTV